MRKKKSLGQHFLKNRTVLRNIAEAVAAGPNDCVIEIGGGNGALTTELADRYTNLHVIEIDKRAVDILHERFENIEIHHCDIMEFDWKDIQQYQDQNQLYIVGNLPYYLTTPILFRLLEIRSQVDSAVLMMQKEVAERIITPSGSKTYGILSVQLQLMCTIEKLFDVPPEDFSPPPKVDSTALHFRFNQPALRCREKNLKKVVKTAFNQRRKKLSNALGNLLGDYKPDAIDLNKRAEKITPRQYETLTAELEKSDIL